MTPPTKKNYQYRMTFCHSNRSVPHSAIIRKFSPATDGKRCRNPQLGIMQKDALIGGLLQITPLRCQRISCKKQQKGCKCQRSWKTPGEQGTLNQLSREYMSSQRLKHQAQNLHECAPHPLYIYYNIILLSLWDFWVLD